MLAPTLRLDGPLWMVGHNVSPQGVLLNPAIGTLDKEPDASVTPSLKLKRFANEPKKDMWLMYACPYMPNGRIYNCQARAADAHESGTTFLANERTLTREAGMTQVGVVVVVVGGGRHVRAGMATEHAQSQMSSVLVCF